MDLPIDLQNVILQRLLVAVAIAIGTYVLVRLVRRLVTKYVTDPSRRYHASKLIGRTGGLVAIVLILAVFAPSVNLITLLTVVGAGLAIAMREVLLSMVGWIHIALRTPFKQGDRIEINGIHGDVIDIRLFHTTLMEIRGWVDADQSTGRIVHIPNGDIFLHGAYNYSRGFNFIWNELPVTVTFRSDWKAAREIMLSFAQESAAIVERQAEQQIRDMSREYLIHYSILTPFVYVQIVENGIRLTLRYLCQVRKRRGTAHALTMSILDAFAEQGDIELAYPMVGVSNIEPPQFGPMSAPTSNRSSRSADDPSETPST